MIESLHCIVLFYYSPLLFLLLLLLGFTLSSHLDVVIVSDLIDSALTKDIENMVTKLSRRLSEASPYRYVHEKVVFHVNRDPTILSQIHRLYIESRLATKTDPSNSAEKVKVAVPRASMEAIMSEHFIRTSSMTTLYVVMIDDALKKFDVSYTATAGFKDTGGGSGSGSGSNDCRRKAFIADAQGFAWIDVFANDDNLIFVGKYALLLFHKCFISLFTFYLSIYF